MGQKVHPIGFRIGITKEHASKWYAKFSDYAKLPTLALKTLRALIKSGTDGVLVSNDDLTKQNRGIITNPYTGDQKWDAAALNEIDNQIYILTKEMSAGQITEPNLYVDMMSRKEGVRIVRLALRTQPHKANLKEDYPLIQKAAESTKHQEMVDEWVAKKIRLAYVKVSEPYLNCTYKYDWIAK